MYRDQHGRTHLTPTWQHRGPQAAPGAAYVARRIAEQKAKAAAKREAYLQELWGPIQLRSSVILSEAASVEVTPLVRTAQGLIHLDGIVMEVDGEHAQVRVMFLSPRRTQGVQYELIRLHANDLQHFGLEPTAWMLSDLRRSAVIRSRRHNLNDGWSDLNCSRFIEN